MKLIPTTLIVFLLFSCSRSTPEEVSAPEVQVDIDSSKSLVIGDPVTYSIKELLIFPVGKPYTPRIIKKKFPLKPGLYTFYDTVVLRFNKTHSWDFSSGSAHDKNATVEYMNVQQERHDIQNILFYNKKTKESYSLYHDSLHILSFAIHEDYKVPMIFYRIVKSDFNGDSMFTEEDAVILYVSDLDGKNFRQITPDNQQYQGYTEYLDDEMILVKTLIDRNQDSTYSAADETDFTEIDLNNPSFGRSIFSEGLKDSLRSMMRDEIHVIHATKPESEDDNSY